MELGTTSAVISFAIDLDTNSHTYYTQAQEISKDAKLLETIKVLQKQQKKRNKRLQRFRRELVTEMILEPIHGFHREDYDINITITSVMDTPQIVGVLIQNEENMQNFFLAAAQKISFLPELGNQFQLLAADIETNIQMLQKFIS